MVISINLDEKSPEELKRLLDSVKTSNLSVQDKDEWIQNGYIGGLGHQRQKYLDTLVRDIFRI